MYSVVLLAAMTASPEAPDFFCCKGGGGGCCFSSCGFCGGGNCGGGGCCLFGGCCNKGYGQGGGGCYAGCYGCYGYAPRSHMPMGFCPPQGPGMMGPAGQGTIILTVPPQPVPPKKDDPKKKDPQKTSSLPGDKAQVVVSLPADAKLIAEGQQTAGSGSERSFITPSLPEGQDFHYTLKIEYQDGTETKTKTAKLTVRGGHRSELDFNVDSASQVTVNLPAEGKLFVNGSQALSKGGEHKFITPELPKGQPFTYQFRAEIVREGKTEVINREVKFKAGEPVSVDFRGETTSTVSK